MTSSEQQKQLQSLSEEYQTLQGELSEIVSARGKLDSQRLENESVQKEFKRLDEDAKIFKLVGPVLLRQDNFEAISTVEGRLEYIGKEIKRVEEQIKSLQDKSEAKKMEVGARHSFRSISDRYRSSICNLRYSSPRHMRQLLPPEHETPTMQDETPTMQDETPTMQDETPTMQDETPIMRDETRQGPL